MNFYKKYFLSDRAQASPEICFYKRTSKLISAIAAFPAMIYFPGNIYAFLIVFFPVNLILDIILFKVLKKRESTYKNRETFEDANPMNLQLFDQFQTDLVTLRIVGFTASVMLSFHFFNHPFFYYFFYGPFLLFSIPLTVWSLRCGISYKHFSAFKPEWNKDPSSYQSSWPSEMSYSSVNSSQFYNSCQSSVPYYQGLPGYDVAGNFTGSSTAIGGSSS